MAKKVPFLKYIPIPGLMGSERTKQILKVNPTVIPTREEASEVQITVFDYTADFVEEKEIEAVEKCSEYFNNAHNSWINVGGIRKNDVEALAEIFNLHALLAEDILSVAQRPKMDESDEQLFCLLNMLYFNEKTKTIESEQISIILGKGYVLSFQDDAIRDVFNPVRQKLKLSGTRLRQRTPDYLCYALLDMIVDNYFTVMEKLGELMEDLEEEIIRKSTKRSLARINQLRKELIVLKRNIAPVRELVNNILRSESELLEDRHTKYYKDVYDHVLQAFDLCENYRDMVMNLQDLYINQVNLRLNEVMKVMAIVTCLLAPATVIGGIFGMNFEKIPYINNPIGFYLAVGAMLLIPIYMLLIFRKRGWF